MSNRRKTKFNTDWLRKVEEDGVVVGSWLKRGTTEYQGFCKLCMSEFAVDGSGWSQVKSHQKSEKHNRRVQESKDTTQSRINQGLTIDLGMNLAESVIKAETIWLLKMSKNDIAFLTNTGSGSTFAAMFPDSDIAAKFKLGPSKSTYVIRYGVGPHCKDTLDADIRRSPGYTLQFDETTTTQIKKQMDVLVRYWSESARSVVVRFLDTLQFGHAPADQVTEELLSIMDKHDLSLLKLITLGRDGPNVNKKVMRLMNKKLQDEGTSMMVDIGPCILHVVHNSFHDGLDVFEEIEEALVDLNQWFNTAYSACRREDFKSVQLEEAVATHVILKHCSTRWLTLKPAIQRLLEQWRPLKKYFKSSELRNNKTERYKRIRRFLDDTTTVAKLQFVSQLASDFESFLMIFQLKEPMVHRVYDSLETIFKKVSGKFVQITEAKKPNVGDVDLDKVLPLEKMAIGHETRKALEKLDKSKKKQCLLKFRDVYKRTAKYLQGHFPENALLKSLRCLDPLYVKTTETDTLSYIRCIVDKLSHFLNEEERNSIEAEWVTYRNENSGQSCSAGETGSKASGSPRVDVFWREVFASKKFPTLERLMKLCLALPHGNADVERSLSVNKYVLCDRSSLHVDTIRGIRYAKDAVEFHDPQLRRPEKVPFTKDFLKAVRTSRSSYEVHLNELKRKEDNIQRDADNDENEKGT